MTADSLLSWQVSDLCIGKPAVRYLTPSATICEALQLLKRSGEGQLLVWADRCLGKISLADVICFLCEENNLVAPMHALCSSPVALLLRKNSAASVAHVDRHCSVLEAVEEMLRGGAQILTAPVQRRSKEGALGLCWITREDLVRFFLSHIGAFSRAPAASLDSLGVIQRDVLAVRYDEPAVSAVPLVARAVASQTAVAVVADDGRLVGEISPFALANCGETVAAAIAALSAGDLMAYVDSCGPGGPPEEALRAVKARLTERDMAGMLDLLEKAHSLGSHSTWLTPSSSLSSPSSSSSSSSSDEEAPTRRGARLGRTGSYSARMGRRPDDAIVCHTWSSLVAVMVQALAHRVGYAWVVDGDYRLAGIVTFPAVLAVLRDHLQAPAAYLNE